MEVYVIVERLFFIMILKLLLERRLLRSCYQVSCVRFSKCHRHEARFSSQTSASEIARIKV